MGKVLKWVGIVLGGLVGLIVLAVIILNVLTATRLNRTYDVEAEAITIPTDDASLERGEYLAQAVCTSCHGEDLSGELLFEEPGIVAVYAANITPAETGVGDFSDADYVRAIRHGIDRDGKALIVMPAEVFRYWSEEDLGATIAYLKTLPPIENEVPEEEYGFMARVMLPTGAFGEVFAAEYLDHDMPLPERPEIGPNVDYGGYMVKAVACTLCHGDDMTGGDPPSSQPDIGQIPPAVQAGGWSTEEFATFLRTRQKPGGDVVSDEVMPFELYEKLNDEDIEAIHLYLQSLSR